MMKYETQTIVKRVMCGYDSVQKLLYISELR